MLLDNQAWERIAATWSARLTSIATTTDASTATCKLIDQGRPAADVVTVFESLEKNGEAEPAGGIAYLARDCQQHAFGGEHPPICGNRSRARDPAQAGGGRRDRFSALSPSGKEAKALLDEAEAKVFPDPEAGARHASGFVSIQPILNGWSIAYGSSTTATTLPR